MLTWVLSYGLIHPPTSDFIIMPMQDPLHTRPIDCRPFYPRNPAYAELPSMQAWSRVNQEATWMWCLWTGEDSTAAPTRMVSLQRGTVLKGDWRCLGNKRLKHFVGYWGALTVRQAGNDKLPLGFRPPLKLWPLRVIACTAQCVMCFS